MCTTRISIHKVLLNQFFKIDLFKMKVENLYCHFCGTANAECQGFCFNFYNISMFMRKCNQTDLLFSKENPNYKIVSTLNLKTKSRPEVIIDFNNIWIWTKIRHFTTLKDAFENLADINHFEHVHNSLNKSKLVNFILKINWTLDFLYDSQKYPKPQVFSSAELLIFNICITKVNYFYQIKSKNYGLAELDISILNKLKCKLIFDYRFRHIKPKHANGSQITMNFYSDFYFDYIFVYLFYLSAKMQVWLDFIQWLFITYQIYAFQR